MSAFFATGSCAGQPRWMCVTSAGVSCDHKAALFASAMAMMTSSRLPLALMRVVLQMEKPVAEPGAVVAGRIAGQAHDRVPQFGEAFSQISSCGRQPRVRRSVLPGRNPPGSDRHLCQHHC